MRDFSRPTRLLHCAVLVVIFLLALAAYGEREPANAGHPAYRVSTASWYGPGFYGRRTACGQTLTVNSVWVAALRSDQFRCGKNVTICNRFRARCYKVRVLDRGAYRSDGRVWDLSPRLARLLGCYCTQVVQWRGGWW